VSVLDHFPKAGAFRVAATSDGELDHLAVDGKWYGNQLASRRVTRIGRGIPDGATVKATNRGERISFLSITNEA
jgi:hypothetical protein